MLGTIFTLFPFSSRLGLISNTVKTWVIVANKPASLRNRPGQILLPNPKDAMVGSRTDGLGNPFLTNRSGL
jgi:hypothetical protein